MSSPVNRYVKVFYLALCMFACWPAFAATVDEYTSSMEHQQGFFDLYYQPKTGKVFLLVKELDVPFLFQSSMPQGIGSNDIGLDRGQLGDTRLVKFQRFGDKLLLKQLNTQYRAITDNDAERQSIDEAFADSVIVGLSIVAEQGDQILVDYSDFLVSDIHGIAERLSQTKQGSFKLDTSRSGVYSKRTKAFVDNTELEALVTFGGSQPGEYVRQVTPDAKSISVHLHHSLIRLPDDQYQTRSFAPFSGFWQISYQDYATAIDEPMTTRLIPRHRLAKKDPSAQVSEAVEPIVYYLDPGIPEPVMSALKEGASWWDQAFENIGYKNAFQVKVLPAGADPMDVRYNVIQWVHRATRGWSYGSSVIDPRTGEIIKGHVTLGSLRVRQDYLIALGLTSPFADGNTDTTAQKEMALARIRQLSAHEVGHTLGIAHNFASSADGRESVMDYPHPVIQLKDGKIDLSEAYDVGMGEWDKHVIAYGYQDLPEGQSEANYLASTMDAARAKGLRYQSDPDARPSHAANAVGHLWDNGETPVAGLEELLAVREVALNNFGLNSIPQHTPLSELEERLVPIYYLHRYQLESVAKLIGGEHYEYERKGDFDAAKGVSSVAAEQQKQALDAMMMTLDPGFLTLPDSITQWVIPKVYGDYRNRESFKGRTGITFDPISAAEASAGYTLSMMLQPQRLNRMATDDAPLGVDKVVNTLLSTTIESRRKAASAVAQRVDFVVLEMLMQTIQNPALAPEARAALYNRVKGLHKWLNSKGRAEHHRLMAKQLAWFEKNGTWQSQFEIKPLPPGSPI